jgi:NitT/TauT family transport system permease protein
MPDGSSAVLPLRESAPPAPLPAPAIRWVLPTWAVRVLLLAALATAWQAYALWLDNDLLFPSFTATLQALWQATRSGELPDRIATSVKVLGLGYAAGLAAALVLVVGAVASRWGAELLATLTAMFNPLPAIALLPLALLWFGLGVPSLVFVIGHSVLWAVALNAHAGIRAVPNTQRRVGELLGLRGVRLALLILVPASLPAILSGLRIGWAFAWRTLIAAELVFGTSSRDGGIGWFISQRRNSLEIADVFAGLLVVIAIGLIVESLIFGALEARTIRRWGMAR